MSKNDEDPPRLGCAQAGEIFAAHYRYIYGAVLRRVHDPAEAEDLTQETFVRAFHGLPGFRGDAAVRTWLVHIAQNVVRDHFRRAARRIALEAGRFADSEMEALPDGTTPDPAQAAERRDSSSCIRTCVGTLSNTHRVAVELHDMAGLNSREIAARLGVSVEAVKIRLHRGRRELRSTFERHCELYLDERNELGCRPRGDGNPDMTGTEPPAQHVTTPAEKKRRTAGGHESMG